MNYFQSNGKLMLTGEYLALKGATTIALPLSYGQKLLSEVNSTDTITWKSKDKNGNTWFDGVYNIHSNTWLMHSSKDTSQYLSRIFQAILEYKNQDQFNQGFKIETRLEFDREWGWGSSSTLIDLVAKWSNTDPFFLTQKSFGGSMYDIACARSTGPILYQLNQNQPQYGRIEFRPSYRKNLYFLYLGKKQNSRDAIRGFNTNLSYKEEIKLINKINVEIIKCNDLGCFSTLIKEHEQIIGSILNQKPVQEKLFSDFDGQTKSLGAWGGDFILAASTMKADEVKKYFLSKKIMPILEFEEIIL